MPQRRILHIDADAFYASVEQRDEPRLRDKPVAVGWSERGGVVLTASYEARRYGVRSAMPSVQARRLCPELLFVPARMSVYQEVSAQIRQVFGRYTDSLEVVSIDEAYLDVSEPKRGPSSGTLIGQAIKQDILNETGLTVSVGVAAGKFFAKLASGMNKPNGLTIITPAEVKGVIYSLPVERIHGVGPVTAQKLHALKVHTGADLLALERERLEEHFGRFGGFLYLIARGRDDRPVKARERKSYGAERTFLTPLESEARVLEMLTPLSQRVAAYLQRSGYSAKTVTLKLKRWDYTVVTRSTTPPQPLSAQEDIERITTLLLVANLEHLPLRLVGVSVSGLVEAQGAVQPRLFSAEL